MPIRQFTNDEKEILRKNPYIKNVGDKGITYTKEFKEHFLKEKNNCKKPTEIFKNAGFDINIIGRNRIYRFNERVSKNGIEDRRKGKSGRPRIHEKEEMSESETIEYLKNKNAYLKQENEFLKKMIFLGKEHAWMKSLNQKDMK